MLTAFVICFLYACVQDWWTRRKQRRNPKCLALFLAMPCDWIPPISNKELFWTGVAIIVLIFIISTLIIWRDLRDKKPEKRKEGTYGTYP